jgi:uncharacterized protein YbaP (TraB family)
MRLKLLLAALFVFTLPGINQAQKENTYKKQKQEEAPFKSLLWEISGKEMEKPSYLFGTMHLVCKNDALLSSAMEKIIAKAEAVYFELDMDNLIELMGAFQYMNMNGGKKLSDYLTEDQVKKVKDWFAKNQPLIPVTMIEKMKPIFLSSMVSKQGFDCEQQDGMEMRIMEEAKKKNIEIRGLETMAYQAGVMDSIPYAIQAKELLKAIDSIDVQDSSMKTLIDLYKQQDLDKLDSLLNQTEGPLSKYNEYLLYRRNSNWVEKIKKIIGKETYLFAVGAGHLPGNRGVIALLRKLGYTVKPVKNEWALPANEM